MRSQWLKVLRQYASEGEAVTTTDLKAWYRELFPDATVPSPAPLCLPGKKGLPALLQKLDRKVGRASVYRVLALDQNETLYLNHYDLLRELLVPKRGQCLRRHELLAFLKAEMVRKQLPANSLLENLHKFSHAIGQSPIVGHTDLLQSQRKQGVYRVCFPDSEQETFAHWFRAATPINALQPPKNEDLQRVLQQHISAFPEGLAFQGHRTKTVTRTLQRMFPEGAETEMISFLLSDQAKISVADLLVLLMKSEGNEDFFEGLRQHLYHQFQLRDATAQNIPLETMSESLNQLFFALLEQYKQQRTLIEVIPFNRDVNLWVRAKPLYYRRLPVDKQCTELVLNEALPRVSLESVRAEVLLDKVLFWFLGGSHRQRTQQERPLELSFAQRSERFKTLRSEQCHGLLRKWAALVSGSLSEAVLTDIVYEVQSLPGFDDVPEDPYPGSFLASGLLSLLFPRRVFTVSPPSLEALLKLPELADLLPADVPLQQWIHETLTLARVFTQFETRRMSPAELETLSLQLQTLTVKIMVQMPALTRRFNRKYQLHLTPRQLDMCLYTFRRYRYRDLEAILQQRQGLTTSTRQQQRLRKAIRQLFRLSPAEEQQILDEIMLF